MMFVHPLFLWALTAVAVPIIIHLFNFRRYKKVYFTNVKFLKELQEESKSRSRLKELLILAARCLAIACLVLAFCQPFIPGADAPKNTGNKAISLYIDNSFSMENVNRQGPLLEIAKSRAREVIKAFGNSDKYQIITNDFEGRHQRFHTKEDALSVIDEIKVSPAVRRLSDVIRRQADFLNGSGLNNRKIYVFSDAQKSTFDLEHLPADTSFKLTLIPLKANRVNNVYVDSCWFETPLQQKGFIQKLHATIVNSGAVNMDAGSAKLFLNGQQIAISSFSVEAGSKAEVRFTFECRQEGFNYGSIKIEDYPIAFDDELFFAFNSKVNISVCLINGRGQPAANPLASLFKSDSLFRLSELNEQTIDYNAFKTSDVLVLNQLSELSSGLSSELVKFTGQGGSVLVFPAQGAQPQTYNPALAALGLPALGALDSVPLKTDKIELVSKFYSGVFEKMEDRLNLPLVNKHFKLVKGTRSDLSSILVLQNGDDLLGFTTRNNASIYLFTAPLNESATNFARHALFVPTIYQVCFNSLRASPLSYQVGSNVVIHLKNDVLMQEQPPHIKQVKGPVDIIPEMRMVNNGLFLFTRGQVSRPGFYEVERGNAPLLPLAFNFSRTESDLTAYSSDDLQKMISDKNMKHVSLIDEADNDISKQVLEGAEGKKLWKLFILLALLFLVFEVALLRLLK